MEIPRQDFHYSLQEIFLQPQNCHPLIPFLRFLLNLSQQTAAASQAVLEAGYMDLILCLCLSTFSDIKLSQAQYKKSTEAQAHSVVFGLILSTLSVLAVHRVNHPIIASRWLHIRNYWPSSCLQALEESYCACVISQYQQRNNLRTTPLESVFILRRLTSVCASFRTRKDNLKEFIADNGCMELISLSRLVLPILLFSEGRYSSPQGLHAQSRD